MHARVGRENEVHSGGGIDADGASERAEASMPRLGVAREEGGVEATGGAR